MNLFSTVVFGIIDTLTPLSIHTHSTVLYTKRSVCTAVCMILLGDGERSTD